jgi:DNA gyrase subunit A
LFFTDAGKVYSDFAYAIPETGRAAKGTLIQSVLAMEMDERVTAVLPVSDFDREGYFVMATNGGRIKRVHLSDFAAVRPSGLIAIRLEDEDTLGWVKYTDGNRDIIMASDSGQSIRFSEGDVRVMGRSAGGVNAIRLSKSDTVVGMDVIDVEHTHILIITENGFGKRTLIEEYPTQRRYGGGVRTLAKNEKTGAVVTLRSVNDDHDIMLITQQGTVIRSSVDQIRETGRNTQGVTVMNVAKNDRIVGVAVITDDDEAQEDETLIAEGETATDSDTQLNGNRS